MDVFIYLGVIIYYIFMAVCPIVMAVRLNLKRKVVIIILSALSLVTYGITGVAAQILIILGLLKEGYCNYSSENPLGAVRIAEKDGYIGRVVVYIMEFISLFFPLVVISQERVKSLSPYVQPVYGIRDSYNIFQIPDIASEYKTMLIIVLAGVIGGFLMNIIVRDPRKTFYFDMVIQWVILQLYYYFSQIYYGSYSIIEPGFAIVLFIILSLVMLIQIFGFGILKYQREQAVSDAAPQQQDTAVMDNIPKNPMSEKPWWEND